MKRFIKSGPTAEDEARRADARRRNAVKHDSHKGWTYDPIRKRYFNENGDVLEKLPGNRYNPEYKGWHLNGSPDVIANFYEDRKDVFDIANKILENSYQPITSMAVKQIEKYYQEGILTKREVIAILMKENGWDFQMAKQIADYYERVFGQPVVNSRQINSNAYHEGYRAYSWNKNATNPYPDFTLDWENWENGYKAAERDSKKNGIHSRFNQTNGKHLFTLSEAAQYLSALFFDLREIHFNTTGSEFYTYHELAQELYEKTEEFYDDIVETAISFDSDVSPMYVLPGDWSFITNDEDLSTDGIYGVQNVLLDKLSTIYDILSDVQEYDSMVSSKIDSMLEYYDKEIYKLRQALR